MRRRFLTLDVFTQTPFAGNPLAVVLDGDGLEPARMQAIAREFNLSETVFVCEPRDPVNTARLRIFTPAAELPFAGHPTIGAAVALAESRAPELLARSAIGIVVEEAVGAISCTVSRERGRPARARFDLSALPQACGAPPERTALALALGIAPDDIGFDDHAPSCFSAGVPFTFVPLASRAALEQAAPVPAHWSALAANPALFLYTPEVAREAHAFSARMFAPGLGIAEDPATGSAVAALAGAILAFDRPADGEHLLVVGQGEQMGRPSEIVLGVEVSGGALVAASIAGAAICVMEGTIEA